MDTGVDEEGASQVARLLLEMNNQLVDG